MLPKSLHPIILLFIVCGCLSISLGSELPPKQKETLALLAIPAQPDAGLMDQIVSTLPKLRKHLILEQTRGDLGISLYRESARAVVLVLTPNGLGSGTLIDESAHVLTNWHVVAGNPTVTVVFKPQNGNDLKKELTRTATVVRTDKNADLAILKILSPPRSFTTMSLSTGSAPEVGQDVFAIGHPRGEVWTFTKGIISQIRPDYEWGDSTATHHATVIQTQTPINPGNSGGPLFDAQGRLIGVNSFVRPDSPGLNYAVAIDTVQRFLQHGAADVPVTASPPPPQQAQLHCPDVYDTLGKGWNDIVGCYNQKGTAPPPDRWIVSRNPEWTQAYGVMGIKTKTQLDTVFHASSTDPGEIEWYMDTNCDDLVEVIGYQPAGSNEIQRYRYPMEPYYITFKARELYQALREFRIPSSSVQFCQ